jgi:hypothetical protein
MTVVVRSSFVRRGRVGMREGRGRGELVCWLVGLSACDWFLRVYNASVLSTTVRSLETIIRIINPLTNDLMREASNAPIHLGLSLVRLRQ